MRIEVVADSTGGTDVSIIIQNAVNQLTNGGTLFFPRGKYRVGRTVSIKNKNISLFCDGDVEFIGPGAFVLDSDISPPSPVSLIEYSGTSITTPLIIAAGDYVEIAGTIVHPNYTVTRYSTLRFVARVVSVQGEVLTLDRQIQYQLTNVTISKILLPYRANISEGFHFAQTNLVINRCIGGDFHLICSGTRGPNGSGVSINSTIDFRLYAKATDLRAMFGISMNDCNNFFIRFMCTRVGLSDGSGTRAFRGNGLQSGKIDASFTSSLAGDMTVYGGRNLQIEIQSIGNGKYYRDNRIISGNRSEAVHFSECDQLDVTAYMDHVDDQALEFLNVVGATVYPKRIATLDNSSEGAIVIKEASSNINIYDAVIRCYNDYGIKIECFRRANNISIHNLDLVNLKSGKAGVHIRDSVVEYDVKLRLLGGYIQASMPVVINPLHNDIHIKGLTLATTAFHAVQSQGDYLIVDSLIALGCNDTIVRAIISSGPNDQISNVVSNGAIYVRDGSRLSFNLRRYTHNRVSRIFLDQDASFSIYTEKGSYKTIGSPTNHVWERGWILEEQNPSAGGKIGRVCVSSGTFYPSSSWAANTAYSIPPYPQATYINANGSVYRCISAGISGTVAPSHTSGISIDGTVAWEYVGPFGIPIFKAFGAIDS
ncbi:hypothetical protein ACFFK0_27920 [Paenibacillus chartarius]|uniref:Pectate lyase superfamily protein domain-containing protein n=1 Tax=Paenibacillus chartarius TaxID=747481 RepID=A0ABV6DUD6_9BACL